MNRADILAKRLLEAENEVPPPPSDEPKEPTKLKLSTSADVKREIDKLMPTKQVMFKGNGFWNACGMLTLALRSFQLGITKDQKWSLKVLRAMNAPEDVIDAFVNDRVTIEPHGKCDALVTVQLYGDTPRNNKSRKRPAAG